VQWFWVAVMGCGVAAVVQNGTLEFVFCLSTYVAEQWGEDSVLELTYANIINGEAGIAEVMGPLVFGVCTGVITRRRWRAYGINPISGSPTPDNVFLLVVYGLFPFAIMMIAIGPARMLGLLLCAGAGLFVFGLWRAWKRGELYFHAATPFVRERVLRRQERPLAFYLCFSFLGLLALGLLVGAGILVALNPPFPPSARFPRWNLPG